MPQLKAAYSQDVDIDEDKKYLAELCGFEEQDSQYRDKRADAMMDIYKFNLWDMETGLAIIDNSSGEMLELWKITNDLLYDNPTTGKIAPGRELANALIGHRLTDAEVQEMLKEGWGEALTGRRAVADVEWFDGADGARRLRLVRLKPYTKKPKAVAPVRRLDDDEE